MKPPDCPGALPLPALGAQHALPSACRTRTILLVAQRDSIWLKVKNFFSRAGDEHAENSKLSSTEESPSSASPSRPETPRVQQAPASGEMASQAIAEQAFSLAQNAQWFDCVQILGSARNTLHEGSVVESLLMAISPDDEQNAAPLPIDFVTALAGILLQRGEREFANRVLARNSDPSVLVMRADLLIDGLRPEGPHDHELQEALELLNLALKKDFDTPGARDRWLRLRDRLGLHVENARPTLNVTLLAHDQKLPFTLVREVARGGAGVVYEAFEVLRWADGTETRRPVALKLAHQRLAQRTQLLHEARIAALFRGFGVVPVFDLDPNQGWLAMQWAEGQSLRQRLQPISGSASTADPLSRNVLEWLLVLANTLANVHTAGWVHGDVKPANILFDAYHEPLLGDFGLARSLGEDNTPGSPGYVSPERRDGAPCSPQDDVYGLGCLIETVLSAGWGSASDRAALEPIVTLCKAPVDVRPLDAHAIVTMLQAGSGAGAA